MWPARKNLGHDIETNGDWRLALLHGSRSP
jgi:hypothetical protein